MKHSKQTQRQKPRDHKLFCSNETKKEDKNPQINITATQQRAHARQTKKKILTKRRENSVVKTVNVILELPEWLSPELILGIIGTATGVLGLLIHFVRLRKEKPDLKIEVTNCWHYPERKRNRLPTFRLELGFRIKNTGHYGTTLSKIEAVFHDSGKEYLMESDLFQTEQEHPLTPTLSVQNLWIQPHRTTDTGSVFRLKDAVIEQKVLKCSFILYHTHGKETFKVTSPFSPSS